MMRNEKPNVSDPIGREDSIDWIEDSGGQDTVAFGSGDHSRSNNIINDSRRLLDTQESRRWRYGESTAATGNDMTWRRAA